jgi:hypothetical protein
MVLIGMNMSVTSLPTRLILVDCSKKKDCVVCLEKPREVTEFAFLTDDLGNPDVQMVFHSSPIVNPLEILMVMNFLPIGGIA